MTFIVRWTEKTKCDFYYGMERVIKTIPKFKATEPKFSDYSRYSFNFQDFVLRNQSLA